MGLGDVCGWPWRYRGELCNELCLNIRFFLNLGIRNGQCDIIVEVSCGGRATSGRLHGAACKTPSVTREPRNCLSGNQMWISRFILFELPKALTLADFKAMTLDLLSGIFEAGRTPCSEVRQFGGFGSSPGSCVNSNPKFARL